MDVIKRENGGFPLFILQINLISNPMHSNVVCKGKDAPDATDDNHINHELYSQAARGRTDWSDVAHAHWVMLLYLTENP